MVVKFNHLLPAMPELGMGLPNAYGRPTPSPYQTTTPSTSHPNSSSALGAAPLLPGKSPSENKQHLPEFEESSSFIQQTVEVRRFHSREWIGRTSAA